MIFIGLGEVVVLLILVLIVHVHEAMRLVHHVLLAATGIPKHFATEKTEVA